MTTGTLIMLVVVIAIFAVTGALLVHTVNKAANEKDDN